MISGRFPITISVKKDVAVTEEMVREFCGQGPCDNFDPIGIACRRARSVEEGNLWQARCAVDSAVCVKAEVSGVSGVMTRLGFFVSGDDELPSIISQGTRA